MRLTKRTSKQRPTASLCKCTWLHPNLSHPLTSTPQTSIHTEATHMPLSQPRRGSVSSWDGKSPKQPVQTYCPLLWLSTRQTRSFSSIYLQLHKMPTCNSSTPSSSQAKEASVDMTTLIRSNLPTLCSVRLHRACKFSELAVFHKEVPPQVRDKI